MSNSAIGGNCRDCKHNIDSTCTGIPSFLGYQGNHKESDGPQIEILANDYYGVHHQFWITDDFGCTKFVKREG